MERITTQSATDNLLARILNGRDGPRRISISPYSPDLPLGAEIGCPRCGELIRLVQYTSSWGNTLRYWSECGCLGAAHDRSAALTAASIGLQAQQRSGHVRRNRTLDAFTPGSFDPTRLDGGEKLVKAAQRWLELITPHGVAPSYHTDPRACLYFYSPGKGRGKTHLAGALLNEALGRGRHVAFADEISYIEGYWAASFEAKAAISAEPGERAWLTVIDDLGQRESTSAGLRDAWYDVVNPRWLKRGWTIITSNWTPDELLDRGTINEATYSRIVQMTRGQLVTFNGTDQRLPDRTQKASDL